MSANPPLIPGSPIFDTNYTTYLECSQILADSITSGTSILTNGHLYNILDPVELTDAANKEYADSIIPHPYPIEGSIQYNNAGSFFGSTSLTFQTTSNILTSMSTTVGAITVGNGTITGILNPPINSTDIVPKQYVDSFYKLTEYTISSSTGLTYTSMCNNIIYRTAGTGTITDTTCTGSFINSQMNLLGINSARFILKNTATNYDSILNLTAGSGVSFAPTSGVYNIYAGYELDSILTSTGSTAATMSIIGLNFTKTNNNFVVGGRGLDITSNITTITNKFTTNNVISEYNSETFEFGPTTVGGVIYRNFAGTKTDNFSPVEEFISGFAYFDSEIKYVFANGGILFTLINNSSTGPILLTAGNSWELDVNSNCTIYPGQSSLMYLTVDTTLLTGRVDVIGIFNTV